MCKGFKLSPCIFYSREKEDALLFALFVRQFLLRVDLQGVPCADAERS